LEESNSYKSDKTDVIFIKDGINELKNILLNEQILEVDLNKVKRISELIYQLNFDNTFSELTDHISNGCYAFEFILNEKLKEKEL